MAKIIDVKDVSEKLNLTSRQLPLPVYDDKVMILQLSNVCQYCKQNEKKEDSWSEESFSRQYSKLSRDETLAPAMVPSSTLFSRLGQVVGCVGCRRSCEHLFKQLKDTGAPSMDPLIVTNSGTLTVFMKCSLQSKVLNNLISSHRSSLTEMLDTIPKYKKSGRCILHSMEGVRCRAGAQPWLDMWEGMSKKCKESITLISCDKLLVTLDNYLRKHRFCHECKNKVHRAYNILIGNISIDPSKEKGYVASLYSGITKCEKTHVHVKADTDFVMNLITRAEPELQGRRERHAKTLEIAQEEVLTCVGLFLYERLQRVYSRMKEEEQAFDILFHVGLDVIRKNFELAVEEKQGFSKFEKLCEELQKQELMEKARKEKRNKKKKNKKKNEESKENKYILPLKSFRPDFTPLDESLDPKWRVMASPSKRKASAERERGERSRSETKESSCVTSPSETFLHHTPTQPSPQHFGCSTSIDSLASRCSQCSRDGGYCSAQCSSSSSRDSSEVACGDGLCVHSDDLYCPHQDPLLDATRRGSSSDRECELTTHSQVTAKQYVPSLQEMLDDFSCDTDEIPEAEVKAWHARLGAVKQKRAELRQTLRQRFQQLCHRKSLISLNGIGVEVEDGSPRIVTLKCQSFVNGLSTVTK